MSEQHTGETEAPIRKGRHAAKPHPVEEQVKAEEVEIEEEEQEAREPLVNPIKLLGDKIKAYKAARKAAFKKLPKEERKKRRKRVRLIKKIAWRTGLSLITVIVLALVTLLSMLYVMFKGPSQSFGDLLAVSMQESSALKFVPRIYYDEEEMAGVLERNSVVPPTEETDTSLVTIAAEEETAEVHTEDEDGDGIEIHEISGSTYKGFMMIIYDPSRVTVGTCRDSFNSSSGLQLNEIAERYGAVAAINGGGFEDAGGTGNGGMPSGVVVANGVLMHKSSGGDENVTVGFTADNKLVVGEMTGSKAMELGLRDALTFGPALVVNGEPTTVKGSGSGLNPRTAIGQRADGAVLMLVIDGRQVNSLGASISDLIEIMMEYGAVNACNLDGGSSSLMYYKGEYLNNGVVLTGSRDMPTAFIVQ